MALFFEDNFDGSNASITGHSPDIPIGSLTWLSNGIRVMNISGTGFAGPNDVMDWGRASYGSIGTTAPAAGGPTEVEVRFTWTPRTETSLTATIRGFQLEVAVGGDLFNISLIKPDAITPFQLTVNNGGSDGTPVPMSFTDDTPYDVVLTVANDTVTGTFNGTTISRATNIALDGTTPYHYHQLTVASSHEVSYLAVDDEITEVPTMSVQATMPMPLVDIEGGARITATLPMPTMSIQHGARITALMPMPTVQIEGGDGVLNTIAAVMPMPTVQVRGGAAVRATMPMPTVEASGTTTVLITVEAVMPMPTVQMSGTTGSTGAAAAAMPMPTVEIRGGLTVAAAMPMATVEMSGTTGSVASIQALMPMPTVEFITTAEAYSIIEAVMPMLVAGPYGRITAVMPMAQVRASGGQVFAVTYETYAVNLQPGGQAPVHEVGRYDGWEFDDIIRWRDAYYGVKADGWYLLGGDTDAGEPIPWAMQTAKSKLGGAQMKVVREAFVYGRVGTGFQMSASISDRSTTAYEGLVQAGEHEEATRVKFGRGLKAVYWSFGPNDPTGGPADIDTLQLDAAELQRKVY